MSFLYFILKGLGCPFPCNSFVLCLTGGMRRILQNSQDTREKRFVKKYDPKERKKAEKQLNYNTKLIVKPSVIRLGLLTRSLFPHFRPLHVWRERSERLIIRSVWIKIVTLGHFMTWDNFLLRSTKPCACVYALCKFQPQASRGECSS